MTESEKQEKQLQNLLMKHTGVEMPVPPEVTMQKTEFLIW